MQDDGSFREKTVATQEICVGDIVRIKDDTIIPADCVVIAAGKPAQDDKPSDCFTKTMSLDGETNLKPKLPFKQIDNMMTSTDIPKIKREKLLGSV